MHIYKTDCKTVAECDIEIVERKGIGHADTIGEPIDTPQVVSVEVSTTLAIEDIRDRIGSWPL